MLANRFNYFNLLLNAYASGLIHLFIVMLTDDWQGKKKLDKQTAGRDAVEQPGAK